MEEIKKTDEEILFPEAKVGDITIRPWSFGILFEISTMLETVLDKMEEKKIFVDPVAGFISYFDMLRIFTLANKEVKTIIAITLGKSEEDVELLSMEDGLKIAMIIYKQNSTVLKNVLSSLFGTKMTETGAQSPVQDSEK